MRTMKSLNSLCFIIITLGVVGLSAYGQDTAKPANPNYNAELAKKTGADQRGMKNFVLTILKKGPNYDKVKGKERTEIFNGHFANIGRLAKEGSLVVAGPFGDAKG